MADNKIVTVRALVGGAAAILLALISATEPVTAQTSNTATITQTPQGTQRTVRGQRYIPTVWVDPDGCEHWVMDDGVEGYMSPHTNRQGIPVCRRGNVCGVMDADQFFATDKFAINAANRQRLAGFFQNTQATAYVITGHTDSRASDAYNMRLSYNRANAVAKVARSTGARVVDIRGYGERMPRASNGSSSGMAQNRRVEIMCIR